MMVDSEMVPRPAQVRVDRWTGHAPSRSGARPASALAGSVSVPGRSSPGASVRRPIPARGPRAARPQVEVGSGSVRKRLIARNACIRCRSSSTMWLAAPISTQRR